MNAFKPSLAVAAVTLLAAGLATNTALATSLDWKVVSPATCIPYTAAGTTAADITISSSGVYNPGTVNKSVICPMPRDSDVSYTSSADGLWEIHYRVSGGSGKLVCTVYVGTVVLEAAPVYTQTASGTLVGAGSRSSLLLQAGEPAGTTYIGQPVNIICAIWPKTTLGVIFQREVTITNTP